MNNFIKGMLVGVGIGLLIAPRRGEETRQIVGERLQQLRGYLPENEQLNAYVQQISGRVSQTASNVKDYAQQAASKMRDTAGDLTNLAQKSASDIRDTAKDTAKTTKQSIQANTNH